ncbi:transaminase [Catenuloplanes indicus]|uniref:Glutamate-1-semialdehyde 2,1-aminomutase n=1 Tax=Catenuloplanes indicus TaxID=137267 RepID=A0AAE3W742_9ACTN|nr:transaminase [Catenuloplanes indicus]MDQ0369655.1 glutamate-1-semialdehyde 2,1-aminomutase [Catenuloplanes indicus]
MIDRGRLATLLARERATYADRNPRSAAAYARAEHLFGRTPMTWTNRTAAGFPLYLATARGAHVTDLDGHDHADFSLGDTAAMAGHSPAPVVDAVRRRTADLGGLTAMLPTEDAEVVGAELSRRFGLPLWSFALTATDANRWAIRLLRAVTGRPRILVNSHCYHGSVDETLIVIGPDGRPRHRAGNVGAPADVLTTSRVAEFNDVDGLARELAHGDVAAVLMEPALTHAGIVTPEIGYLAKVRELTQRHGTYLINDETHTFSEGPGGATRAWELQPDVVTIGKSIGGGVPAAAYGITTELADALATRSDLDLSDAGGIGGTLAGGALSMAATRATLTSVLTDAAFEHMISMARAFAAGVRLVLDRHGLSWSVCQLGARVDYRFTSPAPRNGTQSVAAADPELEEYLHVYLANRGVLLTPGQNMALMCPDTTLDDVARHQEAFHAAIKELVD